MGSHSDKSIFSNSALRYFFHKNTLILAELAVTKSGTGTWGRGDAGTRGREDARTRGREDFGTRRRAGIRGRDKQVEKQEIAY